MGTQDNYESVEIKKILEDSAKITDEEVMQYVHSLSEEEWQNLINGGSTNKVLPIVTEYNKKYEETNIDMVKVLASDNDSVAIYELASRYRRGEDGVEKNISKAIELYEKVLKYERHIGALYWLGRMYLEGEKGSENAIKAVSFFEQAVSLGDGDSAIKLGLMYELGDVVEIDYDKALELYLFAIEHGRSDGYYFAGEIYRYKSMFDKAVSFYEKAVVNKDYEAALPLGWLYEDGIGVEKDYVKAFELYKIAYDNGVSGSSCNLGKMYFLGRGTEVDEVLAFPLLMEASENGNKDANNFLGAMYGYGVEGVVEKDVARAMDYLSDVPEGFENLAYTTKGRIYLSENNITDAKVWIQKAADNGYEEAIVLLDEINNPGKKTRELAEKGDFDAIVKMSITCFQNFFREEENRVDSINEAIEWGRKAVSLNNRSAIAYEVLLDPLFIKGHVSYKIGAYDDANVLLDEALSHLTTINTNISKSDKITKLESDILMEAGELAWRMKDYAKSRRLLSNLDYNKYPFATVVNVLVSEESTFKEFRALKSVLDSPNWRSNEEKALAYDLLAGFYRFGVGTPIDMKAAYEHIKIAASLDSRCEEEFKKYSVGFFGKITYRE